MKWRTRSFLKITAAEDHATSQYRFSAARAIWLREENNNAERGAFGMQHKKPEDLMHSQAGDTDRGRLCADCCSRSQTTSVSRRPKAGQY